MPHKASLSPQPPFSPTHSFCYRADYHGSFINLAARYAAVAAQGGQLVTDAELARQVLWQWKVQGYGSGGGSHSEAGSVMRSYSNLQLQGGGYGGGGSRQQQHATAQVTPAASGDRTGHHSSSNNSRPSSPQPELQATVGSVGGGSAAAAGVGGGDGGNSTSNSHILVIQPEPSAAATTTADAAAGLCSATADVPVECSWLGSFLFKGNPSPVSMVSFSPSVLAGRHYAAPAMASSKGVRVLQRVGVMERAVVRLPAAVEGFGPWEDARSTSGRTGK